MPHLPPTDVLISRWQMDCSPECVASLLMNADIEPTWRQERWKVSRCSVALDGGLEIELAGRDAATELWVLVPVQSNQCAVTYRREVGQPSRIWGPLRQVVRALRRAARRRATRSMVSALGRCLRCAASVPEQWSAGQD